MTEVVALRNVVNLAPRGIWQAVFDRNAEAVPYQSPQFPVKAEHVDAVVDDLTTHARYVRFNIRPNPRAADVWTVAMRRRGPQGRPDGARHRPGWRVRRGLARPVVTDRG